MMRIAIDRERKTAIIVTQTDEEICMMKKELDKIIERNILHVQTTKYKEDG